MGRWADPPAHVNYLVLDAPNAHVIQGVPMESGMFAHTSAAVRPIPGMDRRAAQPADEALLPARTRARERDTRTSRRSVAWLVCPSGPAADPEREAPLELDP